MCALLWKLQHSWEIAVAFAFLETFLYSLEEVAHGLSYWTRERPMIVLHASWN